MTKEKILEIIDSFIKKENKMIKECSNAIGKLSDSPRIVDNLSYILRDTTQHIATLTELRECVVNYDENKDKAVELYDLPRMSSGIKITK